MRVGSLFSGIGGLDLGLERAGMTVVWQSEIDPYACKVLARHWPTVPNLGDITTIDWSTVEPVDLICGGYPCQPFSLAGARAGENDARHLWPYFTSALRELRPRFALLENVPGHLSMGFGRVLGDLAELGFDAQWDCIPAAAVGAPHLRYRVFVVAHAHGRGEPGSSVDALTRSRVMVPDTDRDGLRQQPVGVGRCDGMPVALNAREAVADADGSGRQARLGDVQSRQPDASWRSALADTASVNGERAIHLRDSAERSQGAIGVRRHGSTMADTNGQARRPARAASQAVLRSTTIERPRRRGGSIGHHWAVEPNVGRVAHGVPSRVDRLRTLGNAVVPQVAEFVGRRIMAAAA